MLWAPSFAISELVQFITRYFAWFKAGGSRAIDEGKKV